MNAPPAYFIQSAARSAATQRRLVGLGLVIGVGLVLTLIPKLRKNAADLACKNNLREVGLFAALNADPNADRAKAPR